MKRPVALTLAFWIMTSSAVSADMLIAARTIRATEIIGPGDIALRDGEVAGALTLPEDAIGQEARVTLYAGRPIRLSDVGPAALVERNQIVELVYLSGGLRISADARSLGRGGVGDRIRVMNLTSRSSVFGTVQRDGTLKVSR